MANWVVTESIEISSGEKENGKERMTLGERLEAAYKAYKSNEHKVTKEEKKREKKGLNTFLRREKDENGNRIRRKKVAEKIKKEAAKEALNIET